MEPSWDVVLEWKQGWISNKTSCWEYSFVQILTLRSIQIWEICKKEQLNKWFKNGRLEERVGGGNNWSIVFWLGCQIINKLFDFWKINLIGNKIVINLTKSKIKPQWKTLKKIVG